MSYFEAVIISDKLYLFSQLLNDISNESDIVVETGEDDKFLKIYSEDNLDDLIDSLRYFKESLVSSYGDISLEINQETKNNKDWVLDFEKSIDPVIVGNFFIKTSFHKYNDNYENIEINPSLAFGTGHHFTTRSIIENLPEYLSHGDKVLDVGCGSVILGIVAHKLGADVVSCDIDEDAIKVSKENFSKNDMKNDNLYLGSIGDYNGQCDIILANLVSDVIIALSSDFKKVLRDNSFLFLSGILHKNKDRVLKKYSFLDCVKQIVSKDGDWVTLILRNTIEK